MKKIPFSILAAVTALLGASSVHAQDTAPRMYAEIGYTQFQAKGTDGVDSIKFSPNALSGVFGYQATPNMAVEGLLGLGAGASEIKLNGVNSGVDGKVKRAVGLFVKPSVAITDGISLFARAGVVHLALELSAGGVSESGSDTSLAYGIGANFNLSKNSYIQTSVMNYYKEDGLKVNGFNVAYGFRF